MKPVSRLVIALLCSGLCRAAAQDGSVTVIARTGQSTQNLTGFGNVVLNGSGKVIFGAYSDGSAGNGTQMVSTTNGPTLQTVVNNLSSAPFIGGTFSGFFSLLLNEKGLVSFVGHNDFAPPPLQALYWGSAGSAYSTASGVTTNQSGPQGFKTLHPEFAMSDAGIVVFRADTGNVADPDTGLFYTTTTGGLITIASTTQTAPGIGGLFSSILAPQINNVGGVAFHASSDSGGQGIYTSYGRTLVPVATTQTFSLALNATFSSFSIKPALNDKGTAAFVATTGTAFSAPKGIFTGTGGALTTIATNLQQAPGLGSNFGRFFDPSINNSGTVAFRASNANFGLSAIYLGNAGSLRTVAISGQPAPNLGVNFSTFENPSINNGGTVAFMASGGSKKGLYLSDGSQTITAAYTTQVVSGGTINETIQDIIFEGGSDRGGASQFNDNGQIAYQVNFVSGGSAIHLFTPTLRYRNLTNGPDIWGNRANWTVSLQPASVHDVFIEPTSTLTVTGPSTPVTVKSLTVNGTGGHTATLALQKTGALTVLEDLDLGANGVLAGRGKIIGDVVSNGGSLAAAAGGTLTLSGEITGQSVSTTGPGTVNLTGAQNYSALNALAGITNVDGSFTGGTATITANATLNFGASQTLAALNIGAGGVVTLSDISENTSVATPTVVPEPGTMALLASWSLLILWRVRRVRKTR